MQLPQNALVLVLQHVNQAERLKTCALVCKHWREAATMATAAMSLKHKDGGWDPAEFNPWLQQHGQHVTSLRYVDDWATQKKKCLQQLPCANLLDLYVEDGFVQLGPSKSMPGILHTATGLTKLELDLTFETHIRGGYKGLAALAKLANLQRFVLAVGDADYMREKYCFKNPPLTPSDVLPGALLAGLTNLTHLNVRGHMTVDSLDFASRLTMLQDIYWSFDWPLEVHDAGLFSTQRPFSNLQHLTSLFLYVPGRQGDENSVLASSRIKPALAGCTALKQLELLDFCFSPSVLQGLTILKSFELSGDAPDDVGFSGAADVAEVLQHISSMQMLTCLWLNYLGDVALPADQASAYSALTASSRLEDLTLGCQFPPGAFEHVFAPARCAHLRSLHFSGRCFEHVPEHALQQLVCACPALQSLSWHAGPQTQGVDSCEDLRPLLQLTGLTSLCVDDVSGEAHSLGVLVQVTGLRYLWLADKTLGDAGVLQLTTMRQLTQLRVRLNKETTRLLNKYGRLDMESKVPAGSPPDVWYQLLLACAASPACLPGLQAQLHVLEQQLHGVEGGFAALQTAMSLAQAAQRLDLAKSVFEQAKAELAAAEAAEQSARQQYKSMFAG